MINESPAAGRAYKVGHAQLSLPTVVDWAKAHGDDRRVPELLYSVVRSTRYRCTNKLTAKYSSSAFDLLHRKYPHREWPKKTKYYF